MDILISVVIPCYNVSGYVDRCIKGLKAQQFVDTEFIFVNDGSTDDTLEKIRIFAEQDNRVKIIDKLNEGVSKARNRGLEASVGKYVYFLDGDDYLDDNALSIIADALCSDCDLLILPHKGVWKENVLSQLDLGISEGEYALNDFLKKTSALPISYKIYKRSMLCENNISFDEDLLYGEVYTFFFHYLSKCKTVKVISDALYNYVKRPSSAVHSLDREKELSYLRTVHRINEYSRAYPMNIKNTLEYNRPIMALFNSMIIAKYIRNHTSYKTVSDVLSQFTHDKFFREVLLFMAKYESWKRKDKYVASMMLVSPQLCYLTIMRIYKIRKLE